MSASVGPEALVVDDEPDMLDFIERVLRGRFVVTRAACGEEALAALHRGAFALLITDEKMPRVTGSALLEEIRGSYPSMARVLLSGYGDVPEVHRLAEAGIIGAWAAKPVDSQTLLATIELALTKVGVRAGTSQR